MKGKIEDVDGVVALLQSKAVQEINFEFTYDIKGDAKIKVNKNFYDEVISWIRKPRHGCYIDFVERKLLPEDADGNFKIWVGAGYIKIAEDLDPPSTELAVVHETTHAGLSLVGQAFSGQRGVDNIDLAVHEAVSYIAEFCFAFNRGWKFRKTQGFYKLAVRLAKSVQADKDHLLNRGQLLELVHAIRKDRFYKSETAGKAPSSWH